MQGYKDIGTANIPIRQSKPEPSIETYTTSNL